MLKLLRIEYSKLKYYNAFWIMNIAYIALLPLTMYGFSQLEIPFWPNSTDVFFGFKDVWNVGAFVASWYNILLGIVVIIFTCNEFTNKTMRQNIIDGLSRFSVFKAKFILILAYSIFAALYTFIISLLFGLIFSSSSISFSGVDIILLYFVQTFGYLCLAIMFAFLLRKAGFTIIMFAGAIFVEFIVRAMLDDITAQFFPIRTMSKLVPIPFFEMIQQMAMEKEGREFFKISIQAQLGLYVFYLTSFIGVTFWNFKRRNA